MMQPTVCRVVSFVVVLAWAVALGAQPAADPKPPTPPPATPGAPAAPAAPAKPAVPVAAPAPAKAPAPPAAPRIVRRAGPPGMVAQPEDLTLLKEGKLPEHALWLESLDLTKALSVVDQVRGGQSFGGNPLRMNGTTYAHGVGTQAMTRMVIDLHGAATRFLATVGVDDETTASEISGARFQFWVDDRPVGGFLMAYKGQAPKPVAIDLRGAQRLTLITANGRFGNDQDHGDFASAMLLLDPEAKEEPEMVELPDPCLEEAPLKPGTHDVRFVWKEAGHTYRGQYSLFVPDSYAKDPKARLPVLIFLHGGGECVLDITKARIVGPPALANFDANFRAKCPFLIVTPQLRGGFDWHDAPAARYAMAVVDDVSRRFKADPDRLYATGLSLGGTGTWRIAEEFPDRFAAIAPLCGRACAPEVAAQKLNHLPIWVAVGDLDGDFAVGTREMVQALRLVDGHVRLTVFPNFRHAIWTDPYNKPDLYAWFLSHRRGQPGPRLPSGVPDYGRVPPPEGVMVPSVGTLGGPAGAAAKALGNLGPPANAPAPEAPFSATQFAEEVTQFAPGWKASEPGTQSIIRPGLRSEWMGRKNVLVTYPRDVKTPCWLTNTLAVPALTPAKPPTTSPATAPAAPQSPPIKKVTLRLLAAHYPDGAWMLTARINGKEVLHQSIDKLTAPQSWLPLSIDLTPYAGQTINVELGNGSDGWILEGAYWGEIKVVTE